MHAVTPSLLETCIRNSPDPILLMSHLVLGYPSLEENRKVMDAMVAAGVPIIELQIPFSEPIADGPVIARANQESLANGFRVETGLNFIAESVQRYPIPIIIMTYTNILMAQGMDAFIQRAAAMGVRGLIVPDLPLEEAGEAIQSCQSHGNNQLDWIRLFTPTTPDSRLELLGQGASGLVYCVARRGVTGRHTEFDPQVMAFIKRCRSATRTPLALGFGVRSREDVQSLRGKVEIAVVGTAAIEIHLSRGAEAVGSFFAGLR
ncbi:MAG: tryptophan synthase subunit alpha [Magnetococcales bacterium]|nr:tryptophan synthase subunit alpha [Magnetococcales bacterium]MBF0419085.1 tryptophan synthase subunit alpha [Magnetococcales bacterium]